MSSGWIDTWVEIDGQEFDVRVFYDASPPEPDVNWPGGFELTEVQHIASKVDLIERLASDELESLTDRVQELVNDMNNPDDKGDYLYDLSKDERL